MIRLCCLGQWMEDSELTLAEAKLLCTHRPWALDLLAACRHIFPSDWRNLVHAQKLAGIKNSEIQKHYHYPMTQNFFSRCTRSELDMGAYWEDWDGANKYITEWYIGAAARFYMSVLEPLQFATYIPDLETNLHYQAFMIKNHRQIINCVPDDVATRLEQVCSLPLSKGTVLFDIPNMSRQVSLMTFGYANSNLPNNPEQWERECSQLRYHAREIDIAYSLLCKCQCQGIMNRELMLNVQNLYNERVGIPEREDVHEYIKLVR